MSHYVYFIKCEQYIKIGYTSLPLKSRLSIAQANNPFKLTLLGSFSCDCDRKSPPILGKQRTCEREAELHAKFRHLQVKHLHPESEWFEGTQKLRDYIDENADIPADCQDEIRTARQRE